MNKIKELELQIKIMANTINTLEMTIVELKRQHSTSILLKTLTKQQIIKNASENCDRLMKVHAVPKNICQLIYNGHLWWAYYYHELLTEEKPKDETKL